MELRDKTILITRAASQSHDLRAGLEAAGARVIECPAIEIVPVEDWSKVDRAISELNIYDWVIFTSANAVEYFMQRMRARGVSCRVPVAAVGAATAGRLAESGINVSRVPENFRAEGLLELFSSDLRGLHILLPCAERTRGLLPEELRRRGALVDAVTVYRTVKSSRGLAELRRLLRDERIDVLVFASPSAIRFFMEEAGDPTATRLTSIPIAVIGPVARKAVESAGLHATIEPERATIPDLIRTIRGYFSNREPNT